MKKAVVCGAGGFIGGHMVKQLKDEGYYVIGIDRKHPEFNESEADEFHRYDLCDPMVAHRCIPRDTDEIYQFAADMGGAGFVFTGDNDALILHNSALCNLHSVQRAKEVGAKIFFSSSACGYPQDLQDEFRANKLREDSFYPANPDSEYGWEKIFAERLYLAYAKNYGVDVRIARFHNIYGPKGAWQGGREKAPAAMCRKALMAKKDGKFEIWGTGAQTRSFLYIDDCIRGVRMLMKSDKVGPYNIGSEEAITIRSLANMALSFDNIIMPLTFVDGPIGVNGRNSDNTRITNDVGWEPRVGLIDGMRKTYEWIKTQI